MLFRFKDFKRIEDLEDWAKSADLHSKLVRARQNFNILLLDDKPFKDLNPLQNHGFKISHREDITRIQSVEEYDIVLCDLLGVGTALNADDQGAHVIREIKKAYPEKIVIAYTGGGDPEIFELGMRYADFYLKKDDKIDEWCDLLDQAIAEMAHPIIYWRKKRIQLLNSPVSPLELTYIEDYYVRSVSNQEKFEFTEALKYAEKSGLSETARGILESVIGSAIFTVITSL